MTARASVVLLILVAAISVFCAGHLHGGIAAAAPSTQPAGVAVVELFTSQGCSSCPPAEKVLEDLRRAAERDGRPIFTLAFHVDYWNHGGWADPFSDAAYSHRQQEYVKAFKLDSLYTPQMVVNGRREFVGSDAGAADRSVKEATAAKATARISVVVHATGKDGYQVRTTVDGADANAVLNVAVVEQGLSTEVKGGENGGRRLQEPSVVRWFKTVPISDAGDVEVPPLPAVRADRASVVVFVQRSDNKSVLGAATAPLR